MEGRWLLLAHNGPMGLGAEAAAIWGCDFRPEAGDWGDSDVTAAIAYARACGKPPLTVIAGHMHWSLRGGGKRRTQLERDGVLYVNPARVPRIVAAGPTAHHYHTALDLGEGIARVEEVRVEVAL